MLQTLKIKNLAVIDEAELEFGSGLNILSGETGAGKSIVLEAIGLILGSRANAGLVRTGADEASVEGYFDLTHRSEVVTRLKEHGLPSDEPELLVRRIVHASGKSKIYLNGELATLTMLQHICEGLVDLCGQHEHQSLLRSPMQMELLDRYGGLLGKANELRESLEAWRALHDQLQSLQQSREERVQREEFLRFQVEELNQAALTPGEEELLQERKKLLQSAGLRSELASSVITLLGGDDGGALDQARNALSRARQLAALDSGYSEISNYLERGVAELEEALRTSGSYEAATDDEGFTLDQVQERLALIASFRRKYGATTAEMILTLAKLSEELAKLGSIDGDLESLEAELESRTESVRSLGEKIHQKRVSVSKTLSDSVSFELQELKMEGSELKIQLEAISEIQNWSPQLGSAAIEFLARTNPGEPHRPLAKIASGGELSRMMLAIRRVIADRGGIGVYLFDEIDAGMGGETAFQVGRKLHSVAKYNQVICITHLPQVAAFGDRHFTVRKSLTKGRARTEVEQLAQTGRKEELARMLGGPKVTPSSLKNAAELLAEARA